MVTLIITTLSTSTGCARFLFGDKALSRNPAEKPVVNITTFSDSLECMDEMLIQFEVPVITVTAQDIPNRSTDVGITNGAKEMLITSMSKLSERSERIRFVSFGSDLRDVVLLQQAHSKKDTFSVPDFFIRGGITQYDRNVISSRIGTGLNHEDWNTTISGGQGISFAGLDLNAGLVRNLQMLSGVTSNNVLAIYDKGMGTEVGARLNSVGTFFDFGLDKQDGLGQAVRNMIDLGAIEIVGKLYDIPYLTCLPVKYDDPYVTKLILKEYKRYRDNYSKLIRTVQARLKQNNYYRGELTGKLDQNTYLSIEYFRHLTKLPATGGEVIDFPLYKALLYGKKYDWEYDAIGSKDTLNTAISHNNEALTFDKYDDSYPKLNTKNPGSAVSPPPPNKLLNTNKTRSSFTEKAEETAPTRTQRPNEYRGQNKEPAPEIPAPLEIEIIDQNGQRPNAYYGSGVGMDGNNTDGANPQRGTNSSSRPYREGAYEAQQRQQNQNPTGGAQQTTPYKKSIWDTQSPYY